MEQPDLLTWASYANGSDDDGPVSDGNDSPMSDRNRVPDIRADLEDNIPAAAGALCVIPVDSDMVDSDPELVAAALRDMREDIDAADDVKRASELVVRGIRDILPQVTI